MNVADVEQLLQGSVLAGHLRICLLRSGSERMLEIHSGVFVPNPCPPMGLLEEAVQQTS